MTVHGETDRFLQNLVISMFADNSLGTPKNRPQLALMSALTPTEA